MQMLMFIISILALLLLKLLTPYLLFCLAKLPYDTSIFPLCLLYSNVGAGVQQCRLVAK